MGLIVLIVRRLDYKLIFFFNMCLTLKLIAVAITVNTLCLRNIPDSINCNLKTSYQIVIIFGTNIPDTTGLQMTV